MTPGQIEAERAAILERIQRVRQAPESWKTSSGKTKKEVVDVLEGTLEQLDELLNRKAVAPTQPAPAPVPQRASAVVHPTPAPRQHLATSAPDRRVERATYIEIGGVTIPVCQPATPAGSTWNAVAGKMEIRGGQAVPTSEVRFTRMRGGMELTAIPGRRLTFSEKHKETVLPALDTFLRGRHELKAFNALLAEFARLIDEYGNLNPDDPDYDRQASDLARRVEQFATPQGLLASGVAMDKVEDREDFCERAAEIIATQQFLRSIDENGMEFVPPFDPKFKLTPYMEQKMAWFAALVNRQLGLGNNASLQELATSARAPEWEKLSGKGMTVIVGPRGTGKNKLTDYYCARTNRPLFRYACSPDKEERDLTYDVELSNGEVVRIPSRILTAVTTPNAVLELDEINLLRPNVAKFFNSLFDGDRAVFLNDQVIHAAPGVVFVGLMNPADYDGVENLPETIDDRSNIMHMGYPPFRKENAAGQEVFTHDEALILKEHIAPLRDLSDADFEKAWNRVVNHASTSVSLSPTVIRIIQDLKQIVAIADRTRQIVAAHKSRTGDTRMERDISLRGTIEIARFYSEHRLWEADLHKMPGYEAGWSAAAYAVAAMYLPHTDTYSKGKTDRDAIRLILAEGLRAA